MKPIKELVRNFDGNNAIHLVTDQTNFPILFEFTDKISCKNFTSWYKENKATIDGLLLNKGAILFRGVNINNTENFDRILEEMSSKFMPYVDGFSPRTKLSNNIYTSTEYDQDFYITPHNELSFSYKWPAHLYFCCINPAEEGGETPIGDCREILKNMDLNIVKNMENRGVKYIRNLHGGGGAGPSWQDTFETEDREKVEAYCKSHDTKFQWNNDEGLKVIQYRDAIISHPVTHEKVWFNQIDQFHPSQFSPEIYETIKLMYGDDESLPMYGTFGDDNEIDVETIQKIRATVDDNLITFTWKKGDLLLIDNVLVCHGRMPYKGDRKILVSMTE